MIETNAKEHKTITRDVKNNLNILIKVYYQDFKVPRSKKSKENTEKIKKEEKKTKHQNNFIKAIDGYKSR